jgi:hypothetical protein
MNIYFGKCYSTSNMTTTVLIYQEVLPLVHTLASHYRAKVWAKSHSNYFRTTTLRVTFCPVNELFNYVDLSHIYHL